MAGVTAKVVVSHVQEQHDTVSVNFYPDYNDGRNKEWAVATPALSIVMSVKTELKDHFKPGQAFTLTFTPED